RVVLVVGSDEAHGLVRAHMGVDADAMRTAQAPELGEPRDVREVPGRGLDAAVIRHAPLLGSEGECGRERRGARLVERRGQLLASQEAPVHDLPSGTATKNAN